MTKEQQRVLLHKHLTGEFPGRKWSTIEWLFKNGYLIEQGGRIYVTIKGKEYCDAHHMEMA